MTLPVDVSKNRVPPSYDRGRGTLTVMLWWAAQATLFRCSPRLCYGWRRMLLRLFGAQIERGVLIHETVRVHYPWRLTVGEYCSIGEDVWLYSLDEIKIGRHTVISQKCFLCTGSHDHSDPHLTLIVAPIEIGDGVWIAADVFIGPGASVGDLSVVGARSSVFDDLPPGQICWGTPARPRRPRELRDSSD